MGRLSSCEMSGRGRSGARKARRSFFESSGEKGGRVLPLLFEGKAGPASLAPGLIGAEAKVSHAGMGWVLMPQGCGDGEADQGFWWESGDEARTNHVTARRTGDSLVWHNSASGKKSPRGWRGQRTGGR